MIHVIWEPISMGKEHDAALSDSLVTLLCSSKFANSGPVK